MIECKLKSGAAQNIASKLKRCRNFQYFDEFQTITFWSMTMSSYHHNPDSSMSHPHLYLAVSNLNLMHSFSVAGAGVKLVILVDTKHSLIYL